MLKKTSIKEIYAALCKFAPLSLAEDWDHVGLQVGSLKEEVKGILISLDVTQKVLKEAIKLKANLLITHHPLFLKPKRKIDFSTISGQLAKFAIQNKITILSFHTNLDSTKNGLNDLLANQLGLKKIKPLLAHLKNKKVGLGRIGEHPKTSLKNLTKKIQKILSLQSIRLIGSPKQIIKKIAIVTGSGSGYFREAKNKKADVLITGDVKYHTALDAIAEGICLIDAGHFGSEIGMVKLVANKLREWTKEKNKKIRILETKAQKDPFLSF